MNKKILLTGVSLMFIGALMSCNSGNKADKQTTETETTQAEVSTEFATGVYKGTIPVGESGKENYHITFNTDSSFALKEQMLTADNKVDAEFDAKGQWKYDMEAQKVYLKYDNLMDRVTSFSIIDGTTIQVHNGSMGTKETSGDAYNLVKE
ncbi:copper resistance protein NlpE N-terminal domain-containing protein [Empedobacter brevis]|uniref:copper resistance protein NlpE N-terminal domain-containing protein n=1 Tax=Empedobacter brevis TaxID=247 RepID=UPI0028D8B5C2|nr:copper resistance protein NlpE N-terminal domain-containing protein [Empedobacter brevis]